MWQWNTFHFLHYNVKKIPIKQIAILPEIDMICKNKAMITDFWNKVKILTPILTKMQCPD